MLQDQFYLDVESDAFFDRWVKGGGADFGGGLRDTKKTIVSTICEHFDVSGARVLEVGCFIGDLLAHFRDDFGCDVVGIEASGKACERAGTLYGLELENNHFVGSSQFYLNEDCKARYDLIIFDDVLSWISRDHILSVIGVIDWLLKDNGALFLRDFSPAAHFAFENHHQKGNNVFNFKQAGGHRSFFLMSGKYVEQHTRTYFDVGMQGVRTARPDSSIWADSVLIKSARPLHPVVNIAES